MSLTERALRGLADRSEGRDQQLIERGAGSDLLLEFFGAGLQRVVGKRFEFLFELIDLANPGQIAADTSLVGGSKQLAGNGADHTGAPNVGRGLISRRQRPDLPPALRNAALFGQIGRTTNGRSRARDMRGSD